MIAPRTYRFPIFPVLVLQEIRQTEKRRRNVEWKKFSLRNIHLKDCHETMAIELIEDNHPKPQSLHKFKGFNTLQFLSVLSCRVFFSLKSHPPLFEWARVGIERLSPPLPALTPTLHCQCQMHNSSWEIFNYESERNTVHWKRQIHLREWEKYSWQD